MEQLLVVHWVANWAAWRAVLKDGHWVASMEYNWAAWKDATWAADSAAKMADVWGFPTVEQKGHMRAAPTAGQKVVW